MPTALSIADQYPPINCGSVLFEMNIGMHAVVYASGGGILLRCLHAHTFNIFKLRFECILSCLGASSISYSLCVLRSSLHFTHCPIFNLLARRACNECHGERRGSVASAGYGALAAAICVEVLPAVEWLFCPDHSADASDLPLLRLYIGGVGAPIP